MSVPPTSSGTAVAADERRAHARYHLKLAVTLRGDNNFYTGISSDISEGGLFIATQHMLPIGTPVVLEFYLARFDTTMTVRGVVRWLRLPEATSRPGEVFGGAYVDDVKPGMGVQFDEIGPTEAAVIKAFLGVRAPELFD